MLVYERRVRPRGFGIVDDIDACLRVFIQGIGRTDPDSGQHIEVRGHGCLLGTAVHNINIFLLIKQCSSLLVYARE